MKIRSIQKITLRLLFLLLIVSTAATIITVQANKQYKKKIHSYPPMAISPGRVLIISPHEDDETLFAGGIMIKTMERQGEVYVLYTVDGITRDRTMTEKEIAYKRRAREAEVEKALGMIGIAGNHIIFLRNENRKALMNPALLATTIKRIGAYIRKIQPDIIVIPSFEGGHCDHDLTNFAVTTALDRLHSVDIPVYEGPDYTSYRSLHDYVLIVADWFSVVSRRQGPRFINHPQTVVLRLALTDREKMLRQNMLDAYRSQKLRKYKALHSGDDLYRAVPLYDYSLPPYNYKESLEYQTCRLFSSNCDELGVCRVPFSMMRKAMQSALQQ